MLELRMQEKEDSVWRTAFKTQRLIDPLPNERYLHLRISHLLSWQETLKSGDILLILG